MKSPDRGDSLGDGDADVLTSDARPVKAFPRACSTLDGLSYAIDSPSIAVFRTAERLGELEKTFANLRIADAVVCPNEFQSFAPS